MIDSRLVFPSIPTVWDFLLDLNVCAMKGESYICSIKWKEMPIAVTKSDECLDVNISISDFDSDCASISIPGND